MPRKQSRRAKKGNGGMGRTTDTSVVIVTPVEKFEQRLSTSTDASTLRGKLIFNTSSVTTAPTLIFTIAPATFGSRSIAMASIFTMYKVKRLLFKFCGVVGSSAVGAAAGVYDDVSTSADIPTTLSDVAQLRCSALALPGNTVPVFFEYKPVDAKRWYYTTSDSGDSRLVVYGLVYAAAVSGSSGSFFCEVDYELVYKGAADVS
jgi:hypothetical protein